MYKNPHNRIANIPGGNGNPWVNFFWMLVFLPSLLMLGIAVCFMLYAVGEFLYNSIFA